MQFPKEKKKNERAEKTVTDVDITDQTCSKHKYARVNIRRQQNLGDKTQKYVFDFAVVCRK